MVNFCPMVKSLILRQIHEKWKQGTNIVAMVNSSYMVIPKTRSGVDFSRVPSSSNLSKKSVTGLSLWQ